MWPQAAVPVAVWLVWLHAFRFCASAPVELNPTILLSGLFDLEYYQSAPPYTSRCTGGQIMHGLQSQAAGAFLSEGVCWLPVFILLPVWVSMHMQIW